MPESPWRQRLFKDLQGVVLPILLFTVAYSQWRGYRFGDSNQSIHLSMIKHFADPSLYPGDPLLETSSGHVSYFFPALGLLYRSFGHLEAIYLILSIASVLIGLYARYRLSLLFFDDPKSATLLVIISIVPIMNLGAALSHTLHKIRAFCVYSSHREHRFQSKVNNDPSEAEPSSKR